MALRTVPFPTTPEFYPSTRSKSSAKRPAGGGAVARSVGWSLLAVLACVVWMHRSILGNLDPVVREAKELSGSSETESARCRSVLDALDRVFDERRRVRQDFVRRTTGGGGIGNKRYWDLYEPEANCFTDERLGGTNSTRRYEAFGDGPKFVCGVDVVSSSPKHPAAAPALRNTKDKNGNNHEEPCLVYSVGSYNKVEFEAAVHEHMGCEIHTFDPTIRPKDFVGTKYAAFHPWGIGADGKWVADWEEPLKSIPTIVRELGHQHRTLDVLKIDCEGCEWTAMPVLFDAIAEGSIAVHQIQIEMHLPDGNDPSQDTLNKFFEKLDRAGMRIFHKERNQWGCEGYKCVEYAFVSEEFLRRANGAVVC